MDLNKLTKTEIINKYNELKNEKIETKISKKQEKEIKKSTLFYDIILRLKTLILSLSAIAILTRIFKNYKSIRVILKMANYIIITIFGISMYDALGLGFVHRIFTELKFIFGSIVSYLTDTHFYHFLAAHFTVVEEKESARSTYKKPVDYDWKAEYEKAEHKRALEKWKERYNLGKEDDDMPNMSIIAILLLVLGGSAVTWYYGPDLLNYISPLWNMRDLIRRVMRGRRPGDDDDPNFRDIELDPDVRSISPDMLVYSSKDVEITPKASTSKLKENRFDIEIPDEEIPPKMEQGKPTDLLSQIKKGKTLKNVVTEVKNKDPIGKVIDEEEIISQKVASTSKVKLDNPVQERTLTGALSEQFNKIRRAVSPEDNDDEDNSWSLPNNNKEKFLESIKLEDSKSNYKKEIPSILRPLLDTFPNLSQETIEKLSTPEGLKNRHKIIKSLPEHELEIPSVIKTIEDITGEDKIKMDKIINNTLNLDPDTVIKKLQEELPEYKYDVDSYRRLFMKGTLEEINSGKTIKEREAIAEEIRQLDLKEIQKTAGTSNIKEIKNVIRENYTHYNLLDEIKNKRKNINTLKENEQIEFEEVCEKIKPDEFLNVFNDVTEEDKTIKALLIKNIEKALNNIADESESKIGKQEAIEKLIRDNPVYKMKILKTVSQMYAEKINDVEWALKFDDAKINKMNKILLKEDLQDRELLSENRSIDKIKALRSVNIHHDDFLKELKTKSSKSTINTTHYEDTMNLFE